MLSSGFYNGKLARSKEEPMLPPPVTHPSRENGIFSLFRTGMMKEAPKSTGAKAAVKEAAPKKVSAKAQRQVERKEGSHKKHQEDRPLFETARRLRQTKALIPSAACSLPPPAIEDEEGCGKG